ncbi:MAG: hypothetical protein JWR77_2304, partial [Rhizorhabdus sp.]|nr:hypothetical protein [Rhizorhabdus sp.]
MRNLTIGLAVLAAVLPGAAMAEIKHPKKLLAMTPEAFRSAATVQDDKLEFETVISTEPAFASRGALFGSVLADNYLRAVIDKRTGATRYEVHQQIRYLGQRRDYSSVNYMAPDGLKQVKPLFARHGSDYCQDSDTGTAC